MSELNEAAARLLQSAPPDTAHEGIYASMDEMAEDACLVARAYLERLAADESERIELEKPIDEAWLLSIGAKKLAINHWRLQGAIRFNLWLVEHVSWRVKIDGWMFPFATRGQLLDLLRALGIETKGVANG